jgi:hypothetical protein
MKTKILQNVKLIIGLAFILLVYPAFSQVKSGKIRIGTYDSRIITMAYSRSAFFTDLFNKVGQEYKTAKESNDTVKMKKIEIQMKTTQHLLHQRVFGTGSISSIIDIVKDSIPLIAKRENLNLVVSKWEIPWAEKEIEMVDITVDVGCLFVSKDKVLQFIDGFKNVSPVPLEELTIEVEKY